jgi:hypothetical protein
MKPHIHATASAKRYGGTAEDYLKIHNWMDSSKQCLADVRHRALLHSTFGVFLAEQVFGHTFINSAGRTVSVRDVAEDHVIEDLETIPTVERWLSGLAIEPWMGRPQTKRRIIEFEVEND